jgi:hypothetical protein
MAVPVQVTFDCADPAGLGGFWALALGYREQEPPDGFATWEDFLRAQGVPESAWNSMYAVVDPEGKGPRLLFQKVPEGKAAKNRVHLDLDVGGGRGAPIAERRRRTREAAERLAGAGATEVRVVDEDDEHWIVMRDPEGNEFCLQ